MYEWYYEFMRDIDVNLFDGRPLYYLAKILRYNVRCKISIPEFVQFVLRRASEKKCRVFLLGATTKTNSIAIKNIRRKRIVSEGHHGYFDIDSEDEVMRIISRIHQFYPNILLIGISTPKKEYLVMRYLNLMPDCMIVLCGGMIDVIAGEASQTPYLVKSLGLGFMYRFLQEPRRLFRRTILGSTRFLCVTIPRMLWLRKHNHPFQQK